VIWLDAHLSPKIAKWLKSELGLEACSLKFLGLQEADDEVIFRAARKADIIFLTKDQDFAEMVIRLGFPPRVVWLRVGNTTEENLKEILSDRLGDALSYIEAGESLVEIR